MDMSSSQNERKPLEIIGMTTYVMINGQRVPAKIDTGAYSTSVWASDFEVEEDGTLSFKLFAPESPLYTGEVIRTKEYSATIVKSSNGHSQVRYCTKIPIKIGRRTIRVIANLADRSHNRFPVLIGRKTISKRFLVDVSRFEAKPLNDDRRLTSKQIKTLNVDLAKNPLKFHQKHIKNSKREGK